jgi:hypothetical protein
MTVMGASSQRPCWACGRAVWFSRVWSAVGYYTQPLRDDPEGGWVPIAECPHCSQSLAEFALLTAGFPEITDDHRAGNDMRQAS